MSTKQIDLEKFDLSCVKPNRLMLLIGRRGSGKSTLIRELLFSLKDKVDFWIGITPTRSTEEEWLEFLPKCMIHRSLDKQMLGELLSHQDAISRSQKRRRTIGIIWDDLMFLKGVLKGESIRELFFNGRHLQTYFINSAQYCMDVPADLRLQIDYVYTFWDGIPDNREKLRKYFCGTFNRAEFESTFRAATQDYRCMVVDNVAGEVRWFKARLDLPPFRLGNPVFWRIQDMFGKTDEEIHRSKQEGGGTVSVSLCD